MLPADAGKPGDDAFDVLPLRDDVIEFEINPDRAYALSLRGVAREAALGFDVPFHDPADRDDARRPTTTATRSWSTTRPGCPVFVTRTVTGFDPTAPTPRWLARRVQLAGMRPISLAVDVTNYVMLELGQPIHGYDGDKLTGPIRVRRAAPGESSSPPSTASSRTLSRRGPADHRRLRPDRPGRRDGRRDHRAVGRPPATWSSRPRTSTRSRSSAPSAATSCPREASKRFERGVDPRLPEAAADRVAELLVALRRRHRVEPA